MKWILIRSYEPLERGPGRGTSHDKALKYMLQNLTKGRLSAVGYRTGRGTNWNKPELTSGKGPYYSGSWRFEKK